jgi:hypothetical protein
MLCAAGPPWPLARKALLKMGSSWLQLLVLLLPALSSAFLTVSPSYYSLHGGRQCLSSARSLLRSGAADSSLFTTTELEEYSKPWGIQLTQSNFFAFYRIVARHKGEIVGFSEGSVLGDVLHLDTVRIRRKAGAVADAERPWVASTGDGFQLGAVLGAYAMRYGYDKGCKRAELLCIKDFEEQHVRLVRYYKIAGFRVVKELGDSIEDFQDRLVWGGVGTLMETNVEDFLRRWTPRLRSDTPASVQKEV